MAFALGLAGVYVWKGFSIAMEHVPVELPTASEEVLHIFPASYRDASPYYIPKPGEIVGARDLSLYDVAGYIDTCMGVDDEEWDDCLKQRDAARRFVFDHWKEKRRGYIEVGHPCVDCAPVDHIFVEPDSNGEWHIAVTLETNARPRTDIAQSVRFKRSSESEERRTDSKTVLSFLDHNGKQIDYF